MKKLKWPRTRWQQVYARTRFDRKRTGAMLVALVVGGAFASIFHALDRSLGFSGTCGAVAGLLTYLIVRE